MNNEMTEVFPDKINQLLEIAHSILPANEFTGLYNLLLANDVSSNILGLEILHSFGDIEIDQLDLWYWQMWYYHE